MTKLESATTGKSSPRRGIFAREVRAWLSVIAAVLAAVAGFAGGRATNTPKQEIPEIYSIPCADYLSPFMSWAAIAPATNRVSFSMITNQRPPGFPPGQRYAAASYARGVLRRGSNTPALVGTATQIFSDRVIQPVGQPFDIAQSDHIGVEIDADTSTNGVQVILTGLSWNNGQQELHNLRCTEGLLVGTGGSIGVGSAPEALYVISLGEQQQ